MTDHRHIQDRLDDYLDGSLSEDERLAIERHLDHCPLCSQEVEKRRSLLEMARKLPASIPPPRDLWPAIEAQIQARPEPAARKPLWILQLRWGVGAALAAAAVVVIVLFSSPDGQEGRDAAESRRAPVPAYVSSLVQAFEYQCMGAGKQLIASIDAAPSPIGAGAAVAIEQGVHPLDVAIEETKSALEKNPGNPELLQMLATQYQRKLSLLHHAILVAGEA
jgi:anti-sigma-K factor RskA